MEEQEITKQADFYRWLRERNTQPEQRIQKRIQLEIPKPPVYSNDEPTTERGVFIIQF